MKMDNLVVNHNITEHSIKTGWNAFSNWACKWENEVCKTLVSSYFESWSQGNRYIDCRVLFHSYSKGFRLLFLLLEFQPISKMRRFVLE